MYLLLLVTNTANLIYQTYVTVRNILEKQKELEKNSCHKIEF